MNKTKQRRLGKGQHKDHLPFKEKMIDELCELKTIWFVLIITFLLSITALILASISIIIGV